MKLKNRSQWMQVQKASMRGYLTIRVAVVPVLLLILGVSGRAENWPRFRGPNGQGLGDARTIPVKWSVQDYNWEIELPGRGHSSPVVWDDKVFVTSADEKGLKGTLLCVSASDGRELWRKEYRLNKVEMNTLNSYASATPALDAEHVYLFWPGMEETTLAALTHDGREVWTIKLPGIHARHGVGSSPIVCGEHVIITREQDQKSGDDVASVWLAVDRRTGQTRWRYEHPENANGSYSTPCTYRGRGGREQLLFTSNSHGIAALDPATGGLLWKTPEALPARVVSSPVIAGGLIVATCGQGGRGVRLAAVKPPESGASAPATEVYGLERGIVSYVPTAVVHDGLLFLFHDQGTVSCLRAATGEVLWSEKPAGRYYGSPVCVDGRLYCITIDGDVVVLQAGPKYELLAANPLGEKSHATPAVADERMYLRTYSHLISIGGKAN
jgi:outer membrane protein assembly factor BamB